MPWIQHYYPIAGNIYLSALGALVPILFLFWALVIKKMKGYQAMIAAWLITFVTAVAVFRMPFPAALSAALYGALQGMFPLVWLAFHGVFLYNIIVRSGKFELIKYSIASISDDRRVQAILIGFCFAGFLEGATGPGVSVGIAAAMLTAMGFPPLKALVITLIGNAVPGSFSPVGMPTIIMVNTTLNEVPGALLALAGTVGGIKSIYALFIPLVMLIFLCGWRAARELLPLCFIVGIVYAVPNVFITRLMGPELPSIISPLVSLLGAMVFLKFWRPKTTWHFEGDPLAAGAAFTGEGLKPRAAQIIHAWSPFVLVVIVMVIWSQDSFKALTARLPLTIAIGPWPGLHGLVYQGFPIVPEPTLYSALFSFDLLAAVGTALLILAIISSLLFRMRARHFFEVYLSTLIQLKFALIIVLLVLSLAQIANYSGISFTLGLAFASMGPLFLVFSPIVGWIGIFLTGSITSSAAIFGNLQRAGAEYLGLNPLVTITANMIGASVGKLVSPQSIAIGAASTGLTGQEGLILSKVLRCSLILLALGVCIILILAYAFPGYFPVLDM